jgi:pimeloyl-ACP methyl ester carboxylesterase
MKIPIQQTAKLGALMLLGASVVACYIAYIYKPSEEVSNSNLLRRIGAQTVETENFIFNRTLSEDSNEKPVIFIHGAGTWLYSYRKNIPQLSTAHQVHAFDMPGHGYTKSKIAPERYDLDFMCSAILEYMDKQRISKASLVGHSFGGGWALYFAQKHPDRVDKLVLMAP